MKEKRYCKEHPRIPLTEDGKCFLCENHSSLMASIENRKLNQDFTVKGICRADLIEYIGIEKVNKLSDQNMENIASLMSDYLQDDYWNCLEEAIRKLKI